MDLSLIEQLVYQIADDIIDKQQPNEQDVDLYGGSSGRMLFFALLYKYQEKEKYEDTIFELLNYTLNNLNLLQGQTSLSGYSGIIWSITYLVKLEILDYETVSPYLQKLKKLVIQSIDIHIKSSNFDLMHGFMGEVLGLISLHECSQTDNGEIIEIVNKVVQHLDQIKSNANFGCYWQSPETINIKINTGLAHGVASIVWFLCNIIEKELLSDKLTLLVKHNINQGCEWLINHKMNPKNSYFSIPCNVFFTKLADEEKNRFTLSWCHGDLGISVALHKAGDLLCSKKIQSNAQEILEKLTKVPIKDAKMMQDSQYLDASLCHGSLGIFFIFYSHFLKTNNLVYKDGYKTWLDIIQNSINDDKPFLNLKYGQRVQENKIKWAHSTNLLNGASGHGLILLTYLMFEKKITMDKKWFEIFI